MSVEVLSQAPASEMEAEWYEIASEEQFWFQWRFRILLDLLREVGAPLGENVKALDVGGGQGVLQQQLEGATKWTVDTADLNRQALENAKPARGRRLYYNVLEERLAGAYDAVFLFDVLEHIPDSKAFAASVVKHAKPGGWVFVNVPAINALKGPFDEVVGHIRRYVKPTLAAEFDGTGLSDVRQRYWGLPMLPLLVVRTALVRSKDKKELVRNGLQPPGRLADGLLRAMMAFETRLWPAPPIGTSLMLAGRRA